MPFAQSYKTLQRYQPPSPSIRPKELSATLTECRAYRGAASSRDCVGAPLGKATSACITLADSSRGKRVIWACLRSAPIWNVHDGFL